MAAHICLSTPDLGSDSKQPKGDSYSLGELSGVLETSNQTVTEKFQNNKP